MSRGKVSFKHVKMSWNFDTAHITKEVRDAMELAMNDCVDDLVRVSSQCAPHDKGILEKSWGRDVYWSGPNKITGVVDYSVAEGDFNYALWTHEEVYNLGPGSQKKPPGVGMSGKTYEVGRKYLTRPLYGEAPTYKQHMQNMINEALK
jgi:hypothetical protein